MKAGFIKPTDSRWWQFLSQARHDFYHLPEYVLFSARYEGGTPIAFYAEHNDGTFFVPLLRRDLPPELHAPDEWCDVVSPYGYPTPLMNLSGDTYLLDCFLDSLRNECQAQGIITVFIRLHPLFPLPTHVLESYGTLVQHGQTVSMALDITEEEAQAKMRRNHRQNIRKLKRLGFHVVVNNWDYYPRFMELYRETMSRAQAAPFYFFSDDYFWDLKETLGEKLHLLVTLSREGEVAAAGLFTTVSDIVQAHLVGTSEDYLRLAPMKLLFDFARQWAGESGYQILHLGGGVGAAQDSLFEFKAGFSDLRHTFYTYRMIIDKEKYIKLEAHWQQQTDKPAVPSFFPIYRAPVHSSDD